MTSISMQVITANSVLVSCERLGVRLNGDEKFLMKEFYSKFVQILTKKNDFCRVQMDN